MATVQISLPAPHEAQRRVLAQAKRFNVLACGRRWGKSTIGIDRIVKPALDGFPTAWFSPTYKMLLESWREIQDVLAPVVVGRSNSEYRLELKGSGSVVMFSLDGEVAESVRGRKFACIVIDECALVRNLRELWETAIRACLADFRGAGWFLSTPRGMNDFKLFFDRGGDPEREDWASWQMPTSANPFIDQAEIEAAREDLTEGAFNQEFLAQFVNWEGAVFRRVQQCATAERRDGPEVGHEYIIGADWGRSNDYTVFTVVDTTARCIVDLDRSNKVDYVVQRGRLQALYAKWKPIKIIAEANSIGQPIIEELQRSGLPVQSFQTTNASKAAIVEGLALAFEQGSIAILNDPVLLGELQAFAAEQLPGGSLRYSAPGGGHDDTVISLALAWSAIENEPLNAVYRLKPGTLYSDQTRPPTLLSQNGHVEHWVTVELIAGEVVAVEFFDNGTVIFAEREYFGDATVRPKTDEEVVNELINGCGDWAGLGPNPRRWPGVIIAPDHVAFAMQLRGAGVWVIDAQTDDVEDSMRRVAALLAQGKLRIHERCTNLRREMRARSWDTALTTEGKRRPDPCRVMVATRVHNWRLAQ
jgi:hypothetical protein